MVPFQKLQPWSSSTSILFDCEFDGSSASYQALYLLAERGHPVAITTNNKGEVKSCLQKLSESGLIEGKCISKIVQNIFSTGEVTVESSFCKRFPRWKRGLLGDDKRCDDDQFFTWLKGVPDTVVICSTSSFHFLASCLKKMPTFMKSKIKAVVLQGGSHTPEGVDLLEKIEIPYIIVSHLFLKKVQFPLNEVMQFQKMRHRMTPFGKSLIDRSLNFECFRLEQMTLCEESKAIPVNSHALAAPLTALIASEPKFLESDQAELVQQILEESLLQLISMRSYQSIAREIRAAATLFLENRDVEIIRGIPDCSFATFFGVAKGERVDLVRLKNRIRDELAQESSTPFLQVIGDCTPFTEEGTSLAQKFLKDNLYEKSPVVLYGYTGYRKGSLSCTNQLVSDLVDQDPSLADRTVANLVDLGSVKTIQKGNCTVSLSTRYYTLLYGGATFGDDTLLTDGLSDKALLLEGGVQSWIQTLQMLAQGVSVKVLVNLRSEEYAKQFSAGQFFIDFKSFYHSQESFSEEDVTLFIDKYPRKPLKKEALFEMGCQYLLKNKIWEKLDLLYYRKLIQ